MKDWDLVSRAADSKAATIAEQVPVGSRWQYETGTEGVTVGVPLLVKKGYKMGECDFVQYRYESGLNDGLYGSVSLEFFLMHALRLDEPKAEAAKPGRAADVTILTKEEIRQFVSWVHDTATFSNPIRGTLTKLKNLITTAPDGAVWEVHRYPGTTAIEAAIQEHERAFHDHDD